jgi:hypothetical protein
VSLSLCLDSTITKGKVRLTVVFLQSKPMTFALKESSLDPKRLHHKIIIYHQAQHTHQSLFIDLSYRKYFDFQYLSQLSDHTHHEFQKNQAGKYSQTPEIVIRVDI